MADRSKSQCHANVFVDRVWTSRRDGWARACLPGMFGDAFFAYRMADRTRIMTRSAAETAIIDQCSIEQFVLCEIGPQSDSKAFFTVPKAFPRLTMPFHAIRPCIRNDLLMHFFGSHHRLNMSAWLPTDDFNCDLFTRVVCRRKMPCTCSIESRGTPCVAAPRFRSLSLG